MPICYESSAAELNQDRRVESALSARVKRCLAESGYRPLSLVSIREHEGVLTLYGSLPTFYLKQLAQEVVGKVPGVDRIHNRIQVADRQYCSTA